MRFRILNPHCLTLSVALLVCLVASAGRLEAQAKTLEPRLDSILKAMTPVRVYETRIDDVNNSDVVQLRNGAMFEAYTHVGYVPYGRTAVLMCASASSCELWVERKRVYRGSLIRGPQLGRAQAGILGTIKDVRGRGSIIIMGDGSMYEVADYQTYATGLWGSYQRALIINGYTMVNLDDPMSESVTVKPVR